MISTNKNIIPFFSVVITTYNRRNKVKKSIESVLNQTEKDFEIIVVDDGSSDDTFAHIKSYIIKNKKIKYIFHSNRGAALSKNAGILAASGLFVTFLDSDDIYLENHLEIRKEIIIDNENVDLFHGGVEIIGNNYVPDRNNSDKMINLEDCVIGGTFFAKKRELLEIGGFPEVKYGEDYLLYEKFKKQKKTIGKISAPTYVYIRESEDSICNNFDINNQKKK